MTLGACRVAGCCALLRVREKRRVKDMTDLRMQE
jgi:hypothetical protein